MTGVSFKTIFWFVAVIFAFFFSETIAIFFFYVFVDRAYSDRNLPCESTIKYNCPSVVYESKISFNSLIKKYFYLNGWIRIPAINKNYVSFEDGSEFCVKSEYGKNYIIYSNILPLENNIKEYVKVYTFRDAPKDCLQDTY